MRGDVAAVTGTALRDGAGTATAMHVRSEGEAACRLRQNNIVNRRTNPLANPLANLLA